MSLIAMLRAWLFGKLIEADAAALEAILETFTKTAAKLEEFMAVVDAQQKENLDQIAELEAHNAALKANALRAFQASEKLREIAG